MAETGPNRPRRGGDEGVLSHPADIARAKLAKKFLGVALGAVLIAGLLHQAWRHAPRWINTEQLGAVRVFPAWFRQRDVVYVFSGSDGWQHEDEEVARAYSLRGDYVAGIDSSRFLQYLNQLQPDCVFLPAMLEDYSHEEQRATDTNRFSGAVLLGHDVGATLVYIAQVQAPPLALRAAVAVDPQPRIALRVPLCDHSPSARNTTAQTLKPEPLGSDAPARLLLDSKATASQRAFVAAVGHVSSDQHASIGPLAADRSLRASYEAALAEIDADRARSGIVDLPLVEVPAEGATNDAFAVIYSGDGGWRDLDRTLADILDAKGMSVVGVDVLRYYWKSKSPEVAARDLTRIIGYYRSRWQRRKVVLIGFSFGADVLPFLIDRLPADLRNAVSLVSLLSPERTGTFEVEPSGWFGRQSTSGIPIEPTLRHLSVIHLQCIYGAAEADTSLCTTRAAAADQVIRKIGGHHFDENYNQLANDILAAAR